MHAQDRSRKALSVHRRTLTEVLPPHIPSSFAAFAGTQAQRARMALRCCAPAIGRMPLALVHNDTALEAGLCKLADRVGVPVVLFGKLLRNTPVVAYDPFCGLDRKGVMCTLGVEENVGLASRVGDYLRVFETIHNMDGAASIMGPHPYSLSRMSALVHLDFNRLEAEVLRKLPKDVQDDLIPRLTEPGDQRKVADLVDSLQTRLDAFVNPFPAPALAVGCRSASISSVVCAGGLACVGVPARDEAMLNQIAVEVESLLRRGMHLMLVIVGTDIAGSSLAKLVLSQQPEGPITVGLSFDLASRVAESADEVADLLATLDTSVVFCCPNPKVASSFSEAFGTYERRVLEKGKHHSREFFSVLPRLESGVHERFQTEGNVRAESLVGNARLALVCGRERPVPLVVDFFDEGR